jgi:hypothetical protein
MTHKKVCTKLRRKAMIRMGALRNDNGAHFSECVMTSVKRLDTPSDSAQKIAG